MDWFLYDIGLRHERVKVFKTTKIILVKLVNLFQVRPSYLKIAAISK